MSRRGCDVVGVPDVKRNAVVNLEIVDSKLRPLHDEYLVFFVEQDIQG